MTPSGSAQHEVSGLQKAAHIQTVVHLNKSASSEELDETARRSDDTLQHAAQQSGLLH